jgi:hypothetical protein
MACGDVVDKRKHLADAWCVGAEVGKRVVWCEEEGRAEECFSPYCQKHIFFANVWKNHIETHTKNEVSSFNERGVFQGSLFPTLSPPSTPLLIGKNTSSIRLVASTYQQGY